MAVHTAFLFIVMSIGVLMLHTEHGLMRTITGHTLGGWLLRHMLPLLIVVPFVLGCFLVLGVRHSYFESAFGVALIVGCMMLLLAGFIWWAAMALNRIDASRQESESRLREGDERLKEAQEMAHLGYWSWNLKTGSVEWSKEVYEIHCLDPKEFIPRVDSIQALSPWPKDHELDKEIMLEAMKTHEKGNFDQRFLRPDKSIGYCNSCLLYTSDAADE